MGNETSTPTPTPIPIPAEDSQKRKLIITNFDLKSPGVKELTNSSDSSPEVTGNAWIDENGSLCYYFEILVDKAPANTSLDANNLKDAEIVRLKQVVAQFESKEKEYQQTISELKKGEGEISLLSDQNHQLIVENQKLKDLVQNMQTREVDYVETVNLLQTRNGQLSADADDLKDDVKAKNNEIQELRGQLQAKTEKLQTLERCCRELQEENERLEKEICDLRSEQIVSNELNEQTTLCNDAVSQTDNLELEQENVEIPQLNNGHPQSSGDEERLPTHADLDEPEETQVHDQIQEPQMNLHIPNQDILTTDDSTSSPHGPDSASNTSESWTGALLAAGACVLVAGAWWKYGPTFKSFI